MAKLAINKNAQISLLISLGILLVAAALWYISTLHIPMLDPKGIIALKERNLLAFTTILGFIVIIPVFIMTIVIAWRYREGNTKAAYTPDVATNRLAETIWWGIPILLILILSVVTWISTFDLDPNKAVASKNPPITIKVVAMNWKWLFIYPDQDGIASVNLAEFPVDTPITFDITSDAPMNSFWLPQLGGQIYAMAGMTTHLNINATEKGDYAGSSANISGEGFSDMKFTARAVSKAEFDAWVTQTKKSPDTLSAQAYAELAKPSKNNPQTLYASSAKGLYDTIVMKYMMPDSHTETHTPPATNSTQLNTETAQ